MRNNARGNGSPQARCVCVCVCVCVRRTDEEGGAVRALAPIQKSKKASRLRIVCKV